MRNYRKDKNKFNLIIKDSIELNNFIEKTDLNFFN